MDNKEREKVEIEAKNALSRAKLMAWLPGKLVKQPSLVSGYEKSLEEDKSTYSISFKRYGDFVAVFETRRGEKTVKSIQLLRQYVKNEKGNNTTLRPASITFTEGAAPNLQGHGCAYISNQQTQEGNEWVYKESCHLSNNYDQYGYRNTIMEYIKTGLAQAAVDDVVSFDGAGVNLRIPFGLGRSVYDKLLTELQ